MISVGLDIPRLGLMGVLGQPKTAAEYIQATSRVGRTDDAPGLVVTLLNIHKPRDRSHYERFRHYHETFYRSVEVGSVTPFSARALDRGFAGALVALARHLAPALTPPLGAEQIADVRVGARAAPRRELFRARCASSRSPTRRSARSGCAACRTGSSTCSTPGRRSSTATSTTGSRCSTSGTSWTEAEAAAREMLDTDFESEHHRKFRVNRSLRDVEPSVNLFLKDLSGGWPSEDGDEHARPRTGPPQPGHHDLGARRAHRPAETLGDRRRPRDVAEGRRARRDRRAAAHAQARAD